MNKRYFFPLILIFTGILFILSGCGGGVEAPEGATITTSTDSITVTVTDTSSHWHKESIVITVKDANGIPLKDVVLRISYVWAIPDYYGLVQFYSDGTPVDSPFYAETDEEGNFVLELGFLAGGGLEYSGDIHITSGSASANVEFKVEAETSS
jgi:hypothetical protein